MDPPKATQTAAKVKKDKKAASAAKVKKGKKIAKPVDGEAKPAVKPLVKKKKGIIQPVLRPGKIKYDIERKRIIRRFCTHKKFQKVKYPKKIKAKDDTKKPKAAVKKTPKPKVVKEKKKSDENRPKSTKKWPTDTKVGSLKKKQRRSFAFVKKPKTKKTDEAKKEELKKKNLEKSKKGNRQAKRVKKVKPRDNYPTEDQPKGHTRKKGIKIPTLKKTLKPGTVCIVLTGDHKGKRVIFLKQLDSGLALITGPFRLNKCPLRRINQIYLIGTKTRVNLGNYRVPKNINDNMFKRKSLKKKAPAKKEAGVAFTVPKKEKYRPTESRRLIQRESDIAILKAINKSKNKKALTAYLMHKFSLNFQKRPHLLNF